MANLETRPMRYSGQEGGIELDPERNQMEQLWDIVEMSLKDDQAVVLDPGVYEIKRADAPITFQRTIHHVLVHSDGAMSLFSQFWFTNAMLLVPEDRPIGVFGNTNGKGQITKVYELFFQLPPPSQLV